MVATLKVISYNVKGLNNPVKRKKILTQLKQLHCQIAYLQESHLSDEEHKKLIRSWASQVFFSSHPSGRRCGVAILVHKMVQFTLVSQFNDREGRYILVNGTIEGTEVSLLNVYAPNDNNPQFITSLFKLIVEKSKGILLFGGDMNTILSQSLDRLPASTSPLSSMSRTLKNNCDETGLVDVWRYMHPRVKDFSYYSIPHDCYSRIDLIFTPKSEAFRVTKCDILQITLSDHAPIALSWDLGGCYTSKRWRFNTGLLNDDEFIKFIQQEFKTYLEFNMTPEISPVTLWECAKAYIRGRIIAFASAKKKKNGEQQANLEIKIKGLERQHKESRLPEVLKELKNARLALNRLTSSKVERNLRFVKQKYYESGDRSSRLLAYRLKKQQALSTVSKIRTMENSFVSKPADISSAFADFYKALYKNTDTCNDAEEIKSYLQTIDLPKLSTTARNKMEAPISEIEIKEVITKLKNNKSPGTDGFSNEFYKKFSDTVSPLLLGAFRHSLQTKELPKTWGDAIITVIHKEGKDPTMCGSYRPISLLNCDLKIMTTILSRRLNSIIGEIIFPDQCGFIMDRYYGNNIRRLLNVITYSQRAHKELMILGLDGEKAFDRVSYAFLFQSLEQFGFGPKFINCIKVLYSDPRASVRVNGNCSSSFELERGCRQGCSLSPLLFNISIEVLAQLIRAENGIKGVKIGTEEHKISLYADDVLLYLTSPATSVPCLLDTIKTYGRYSGYKVNIDKTEAMDIGGTISQQTKSLFSFKWPRNGIKYLGIYITPTVDQLFEANYPRLINKIRADIDRWTVLPLSLIGRIESVRMNILPRLLYPFQMLPVSVPTATFNSLNKLISRFIWQGRRPRIRFKTLQLAKTEGGLALPNLKYYFWAAQLRPLTSWIENDESTRWLKIEKTLCTQAQLAALPFSGSKINSDALGVWSRFTIKIWKEVQKEFKLPLSSSSVSSIGCMGNFVPSRLDAGFQGWSLLGLRYIHQLFSSNQLKSFEQLREEFNLPRTDFYRYLQLRHYLQRHSEWDKIQNPSRLELFLMDIQKFGPFIKLISTLYQTFLEMVPNDSVYIKAKWEAETQQDISEEEWEGACTEAHKVTNSNSWREYQWKVVSRFFKTPLLTGRAGSTPTTECWRECGEQVGNHTHIFWTCPKLQQFWTSVFNDINRVFDTPIEREFKIAILGVVPTGLEGRARVYLLQILLAAAKKTITINWLGKNPPTHKQWIDKVREIRDMEEITYLVRLQMDHFIKRWTPFTRIET